MIRGRRSQVVLSFVIGRLEDEEGRRAKHLLSAQRDLCPRLEHDAAAKVRSSDRD
jgi:hypothetical protein